MRVELRRHVPPHQASNDDDDDDVIFMELNQIFI